jgi:glyoxylase-like metal-dependent hydrolase (beta-lactamase superfamily II)
MSLGSIGSVIIERAMNDDFLSNTYLVAGSERSVGFFVDAGGPVAPLLEHARQNAIDVTHVLLTHHHWDHVSQLPQILEAFPSAEVLIHPLERPLVADEFAGHITGTMEPGEEIVIGGLTVTTLPTPGHTAGMLSLLVDGHVFTGDTLFKNSVGGVRAPGHTTFADIKHSIMDVLLGLPGETTIHPGHTDPTTVGEELETNSFVRIWRGLDPEGDEPCTALDEPATLVHFGDDYDGGHKAWVRWRDGSDDIVPGSKVVRG